MNDSFHPLSDLPMGFGMALTQNPQAMAWFSSLAPERQKEIVAHTHAIRSKAEMQAFVRHLPDGQKSF